MIRIKQSNKSVLPREGITETESVPKLAKSQIALELLRNDDLFIIPFNGL